MENSTLRKFDRWKARVTIPELADELAAMDAAGDASAIEDAFFQDLAFGTAGLRGVIGAGSNRMNYYTVAQATQGLADYLNANFRDPSVAIAHDSRHKGDFFAQTAAGVLAANGVKAYLYPRLEPTPALSFATRDLGCSAGINITASHNPAQWNGYKVYGPDGCQITEQAAAQISERISQIDLFDGIRIVPFEDALSQGSAVWIGEETVGRFIDAVELSSAHVDAPACADDLKLVYTPLNGTGLECVGAILGRIGIDDVTLVPEQSMPDGDFPTCPYPNPEIREALERGLALCDEVHPDLLVATDPDADRIGIAVPHGSANQLVTGNELGVLLTHWLATRVAQSGGDLARKVVVSTIVSSSMLDAIATDLGFELRRTLTGFKYIGEQIGLLEAAGQSDRYLFGFEESYGYLAGTHVRDKDAIVATMLVCQMARDYKSRGMDLVDALGELYARYGHYRNATLNFAFPGAAGAQQMRDAMAALRSQPPAQVAGLAVLKTVDYAGGAPMPVLNGADACAAPQQLPPSNVFEIQLEGDNKLIVRPSGTEPKIKVYVFSKGADAAESTEVGKRLEAQARGLLGL